MVDSSREAAEQFKKFRTWFFRQKWYDDPVYGEIAYAAWQASRSAAIEEIIGITKHERASWPGEPCEAVRQGLTNVIKSLRALKGEG